MAADNIKITFDYLARRQFFPVKAESDLFIRPRQLTGQALHAYIGTADPAHGGAAAMDFYAKTPLIVFSWLQDKLYFRA